MILTVNPAATDNNSTKTKTDDLEVAIYPNPVSGVLNVEIIRAGKSDGLVELSLLNAWGQVYSSSVVESGVHRVDVSELVGGSYWVRVVSAKTVGIEKIVVQGE